MIDSLINTLLVIAGLYVYLSLFRQVAVRQNGAAALGDREFGVPEAAAAILLIGWFALNILAASKVEHATFQTRDLLITGCVFSRRHFQPHGAAPVARLQCLFVRRIFPSRVWTNCQHRGGSAFRRLSVASRGRWRVTLATR